jgi:hypothetical protein
MEYTAKQTDDFRRAKRYVAYCAGKIVSGERISDNELETARKIVKIFPRKVYNSDIKGFMRIIKNEKRH